MGMAYGSTHPTRLRDGEEMTGYGRPETVHVENDWYDGPRAGVANIGGEPHRFKSLFDETDDEYLGTFLVWPLEEEVLDLEREQWQIFVAWNARYESGEVSGDSHPGYHGTNARWDEIEAILKPGRDEIPASARRAIAEMTYLDREVRYANSGPAYMLGWKFLENG
ncbi:hypothetical protein [Pseudoxanthomonas sp. SE1]|uniref:hypothetical protein n=1 Tax=Pseudoxanthomonas sp. SE1 TaxID=1664560 RepID=UPI00240D61EC|nr:hypothetical protein [Pseudoxanthomonas sp. SE1]WFC40608.1 hypothetical protein OY559_12355 [Pseudoxanthomonas sp. SE1]